MNDLRGGFVIIAETNETRIEMKLIRNVLLVTALLALAASAQLAPPPPSTTPRVPPAQGPGPGPGKMPPGLMHPQQPAGPPPVMPDKEKLGYAIGFNIGTSAKKDGFDVDADSMAAAMKDIQAGRPTRFNETEVKKI